MTKNTETKKNKDRISRRNFLGGMAAGAAFTIVPRRVLGGVAYAAPSDKLNIAAVGSGGMGGSNIEAVSSQNIVALCDVDDARAAGTYNKYPNVPKYKDFRKMLEKEKSIEAVIVATPDHTHATIAMAAMKMGKHVYVQKPLTRTVYEARMLTEAAHKYKVKTQMGNQGHSGEGIRLICEWIWDGAIGDVYEVHAWTNRPIWPQAIGRPTDTPPVPETLDWDLWLGPSPKRPYHPAYLPFAWRGWWDFGTGALGDMACHIIDPIFWALKLGYPTSVEATCSKQLDSGGGEVTNHESFPIASMVNYTFPARDKMPEVKMTWYDGGLLPRRPEELEEGRRMGDGDGGVLFVGTKGKLTCGCYGRGPQIIPYSKMQEYKRPEKYIKRIETSHEMNWVEACKGGPDASSNFDYSGPLTETVVMGNLAIRYPGKYLKWDGKNMKVTNFEEANAFVNQPYREGWTL